MTKLFNRFCKVTANGVTVSGDQPGERGFRVTFSVTQTLSGEHQVAEASIFNLGEASRRQIETVALGAGKLAEREFRIEAGYQDGATDAAFNRFIGTPGFEPTGRLLLFDGNFVRGSSSKTETEWITKIVAAEGHSSKFKVINKGFPKTATVTSVIGHIGEVMGADAGPALSALADPQVATTVAEIKHEQQITGQAKQVLRRLARLYGFDWWFLHKKLYVQFRNQTNDQQGVVMNEDTGLVLSPERFIDNKQPEAFFIRFDSFLNATIFPGQLIRLKSKTYSGDFKCVKAMHIGDTHGPRWHTSCEALLIGMQP